MKFCNIGTILMKLRKHDKNISHTHTIEDEAQFKTPLLLDLIDDDNLKQKIRKNPAIVHEFITITGR